MWRSRNEESKGLNTNVKDRMMTIQDELGYMIDGIEHQTYTNMQQIESKLASVLLDTILLWREIKDA